MKSPDPAIGSYLAALLPHEQRAALDTLRETIRAVAPDAEERISYGVPAFRLNGPLVGYGAASRHCALYLMSGSTVEAFRDQLEGFSTSKGTIRFTPERPLPAELVRKLVLARVEENARSSGDA